MHTRCDTDKLTIVTELLPIYIFTYILCNCFKYLYMMKGKRSTVSPEPYNLRKKVASQGKFFEMNEVLRGKEGWDPLHYLIILSYLLLIKTLSGCDFAPMFQHQWHRYSNGVTIKTSRFTSLTVFMLGLLGVRLV